jgi:hypothetical protein
MKFGRNLGKKVGSRQTSTLDCQALKTNPSKPRVQRALHRRCGREKSVGIPSTSLLSIASMSQVLNIPIRIIFMTFHADEA